MTENEHFLLDWHPEPPVRQSARIEGCSPGSTPADAALLAAEAVQKTVLICSPCSGHGFKFVPVIGEVCAAMLLDKNCGFDLSLFSFASHSAFSASNVA
jgi:sarcosine oxidase